jgi:hypothetical protein
MFSSGRILAGLDTAMRIHESMDMVYYAIRKELRRRYLGHRESEYWECSDHEGTRIDGNWKGELKQMSSYLSVLIETVRRSD